MRHLLSIIGLTLVMLAIMSITPVMASNHKDGDSYKEPEVTKPQDAPPAIEDKQGEPAAQPAPVAPEEKMETKKEEAPKCPAVKTWIAKKKDYLRHMDSEMMDRQAINFMANICNLAILPFIDLTKPSNEGYSQLDMAGGPRRIVENLAGAFMKKGYLVLPPMDAEAVLDNYLKTVPVAREEDNSSEAANNRMYYTVLPDRTLTFMTSNIPGLKQGQKVYKDEEAAAFLSAADIVKIATELDADCIIRGFVQEYAIEKSVHADLRTFLPPFIGLISPEHRSYIEVSYYIYDGKSGQMVWNGTMHAEDIADWPLFERDSMLMRDSEDASTHRVMRRVTPNWQDLVMNHSKWIECDSWDMIGNCPMGGEMMNCEEGTCPEGSMKEGACKEGTCPDKAKEPEVAQEKPEWVNPMRHGWHKTYKRCKG
jgi:hypothetical protein